MFRYPVIFLSLKILLKGVVLISNKCSIPNNVKALVKAATVLQTRLFVTFHL